jgi:hypothetical protein
LLAPESQVLISGYRTTDKRSSPNIVLRIAGVGDTVAYQNRFFQWLHDKVPANQALSDLLQLRRDLPACRQFDSKLRKG